jgi:hypothetical protein
MERVNGRRPARPPPLGRVSPASSTDRAAAMDGRAATPAHVEIAGTAGKVFWPSRSTSGGQAARREYRW